MKEVVRKRRRVFEWLAGVVAAAACFAAAAAILFMQACGEGPGGADAGAQGKSGAKATELEPGAEFVGAKKCAECHAEEYAGWKGSHHDLAMQPATEETVVGDFGDVTFTHYGDTTRFFRKDGRFFVNATGPDGEKADYPVEYTFGVYPLQQYLFRFPGGRLQALFLCWDSRSKEEGGQRWYHLYPDEAIPHTDVLHWTGPNFNWNFMCAECHSTELKKRYDLATETYDTTYAEMNVSCEACHGPGSKHVEWADYASRVETSEGHGDMGLTVRLKEAEEGEWLIDPESQQPVRSRPLESTVQVEACAPCHAHRRPIVGEAVHGRRFLDTHLPTLLDNVHYHEDGQIKEEVYVYGSFTQSKMFHKGVRCNDCHDPHSLKLQAPGNALCVRCHLATRYDTPAHHFHPFEARTGVGVPGVMRGGVTGSECVECHMPETRYMVVDGRRDHSIRIPRPDLSLKLGSPNACTKCHEDKDDTWAAEAFRGWWGEGEREPHYGEVLAAGRRGTPGAEAPLIALAGDEEKPAIVRATALSVLRERPTQEAMQPVVEALKDEDPIVRESALGGLAVVDPVQRLDLAGDLLRDPVRAVRIEAARVLASVPADVFEAETRAAFEAAMEEFVEAQMAVADRAGAHVALGLLYTDMGEVEKAEEAYRTGFRVEPRDVPSRVNLAELLYGEGRAEEGEALLREAVALAPGQSVTHEALGRFLIRLKRYGEGTESIGRAAELAPGRADLQYFYGVALNQAGRFGEALPYLERAIALAPGNQEYLMGVVAICRDNAAWEAALRYAEELVRRYPGEPGYRELRDSIQAGAR